MPGKYNGSAGRYGSFYCSLTSHGSGNCTGLCKRAHQFPADTCLSQYQVRVIPAMLVHHHRRACHGGVIYHFTCQQPDENGGHKKKNMALPDDFRPVLKKPYQFVDRVEAIGKNSALTVQLFGRNILSDALHDLLCPLALP